MGSCLPGCRANQQPLAPLQAAAAESLLAAAQGLVLQDMDDGLGARHVGRGMLHALLGWSLPRQRLQRAAAAGALQAVSTVGAGEEVGGGIVVDAGAAMGQRGQGREQGQQMVAAVRKWPHQQRQPPPQEHSTELVASGLSRMCWHLITQPYSLPPVILPPNHTPPSQQTSSLPALPQFPPTCGTRRTAPAGRPTLPRRQRPAPGRR